MLSTIKRLQSDERGTIAIIFGLTAFVIFWCLGLAIDSGRAYAVNARIARAIDAAALAGARGMRINNLSNSETEALTREFFKLNFEAGGGDITQIQGTPDVKLNRGKGSVELNVVAFVPTTFASIGGMEKMTITKGSVAIFDSKDLEVGLQLDMTGSMAGSKIADLRLATNDFIDILLPDASSVQKVRIGLAPFSSGVNAGSYLKAVNGNRSSSNNCTFERRSPTYQATDDAPINLDALKISSDVGGATCPAAQVVPMTDDKTALKNTVATFAASGATAGHLGTAWASYLLSPKWDSIWPAASKPTPYNDTTSRKIAVLMTDGEYNTVGGNSSMGTQSNAFALSTCAAMKANGITIYTIGFGSGISGSAKTVLQSCASGPEKALLAENGTQLRGVFHAIANEITSLRLSQ